MKQDFVFGYGSLINKESRNKTEASGEAIPVVARGIRRGWMIHMVDHRATALSITKEENAICNGVVFPLVTTNGLAKFDERECKAGYERIQIGLDAVPLGGASLSEGTIWAYVSNYAQTPSKDMPVIQSYVDVIVTGCLRIGKDFAKEFVRTTDGWAGPWEDDRSAPRYVRPMARDASLETRIDELLAETIPEYFARRK